MGGILVTGASGKLGAYVIRHLQAQGCDFTAWSGQTSGNLLGQELKQVDLTCQDSVAKAWDECGADVVIHCAALSAVGDCFADPHKADLVNHLATAKLGELAPRIVYVSTDMVFDGQKGAYGEGDAPNPVSEYGRSKLAGERALHDHSQTVIARVGLLYGPSLSPKLGFFDQQMQALKNGESLNLFHDEWRTPLALDEAAAGLVHLASSDSTGIYHLAGPEKISRLGMGQGLCDSLGCSRELLLSVSQKSVDFSETRPPDVSLHCNRAKIEWGWSPLSYDEGLKRLIGILPTSSTKK